MTGRRVLGIVLAGGAGGRLMPLTAERAKAAVPVGGLYRLVDFALSNLVNGRPAYRCRHGHTSAARPEPGRPGNTYVREDQIVPHLAAIAILLAGLAGKPGRGNSGLTQVTGPADTAALIDQLRTDGVVLT